MYLAMKKLISQKTLSLHAKITTMLDDTYFMKKAMEEAEAAFQEDEIPVGAVIVC